MRSFQFIVEGTGQFPFDMLRYDACWPKAGDDALKMEALHYPQARGSFRQITLRHDSSNRMWSPTVGRWLSFTWRVVENSVKEV